MYILLLIDLVLTRLGLFWPSYFFYSYHGLLNEHVLIFLFVFNMPILQQLLNFHIYLVLQLNWYLSTFLLRSSCILFHFEFYFVILHSTFPAERFWKFPTKLLNFATKFSSGFRFLVGAFRRKTQTIVVTFFKDQPSDRFY